VDSQLLATTPPPVNKVVPPQAKLKTMVIRVCSFSSSILLFPLSFSLSLSLSPTLDLCDIHSVIVALFVLSYTHHHATSQKSCKLTQLPAFDFASKKTGHDFAPGTDEKITDGARGLYEKATGYVPSSFSLPSRCAATNTQTEARSTPSTPTRVC